MCAVADTSGLDDVAGGFIAWGALLSEMAAVLTGLAGGVWPHCRNWSFDNCDPDPAGNAGIADPG